MQYHFTFRQRKRGNWQAILSYKDARGNWRQKSRSGFLSKADASRDSVQESMLDEIRNIADIAPDAAGMTLRSFLPIYLADRPDLARNSITSYERSVAALAMIADVPLAELSYGDVNTCLAAISYAPSSKKHIFTLLKALLRAAVRYGFIRISPIAEMKYNPRVDTAGNTGRVRTMTDEEIDRLLALLKRRDPEAWILAGIAAYTGARRGECLAICWDDIDLKRGQLTIDKQVAYIGKRTIGVKRVKSKNSTRTVPIPQKLVRMIREYRAICTLYTHRRLTRFLSPDVFGGCIRYACPGHSIHDLRHTYATKLVASGRVDIKTAAALLGDSIATVEKIYLHYTDDMKQKAALDIQQIFL